MLSRGGARSGLDLNCQSDRTAATSMARMNDRNAFIVLAKGSDC